jgi:hypothetical protein
MGAGQPGSPIIEQRAGTFECNFWEGKEGWDCVHPHGQLFNQPCLCNKAPIKTLGKIALWAFLVSHTAESRGHCIPEKEIPSLWEPPRSWTL